MSAWLHKRLLRRPRSRHASQIYALPAYGVQSGPSCPHGQISTLAGIYIRTVTSVHVSEMRAEGIYANVLKSSRMCFSLAHAPAHAKQNHT
jgi:hypothetical protein